MATKGTDMIDSKAIEAACLLMSAEVGCVTQELVAAGACVANELLRLAALEPISHAGDCTIYAALVNGEPTYGICTCGYGARAKRTGADFAMAMYSDERRAAIFRDSGDAEPITGEWFKKCGALDCAEWRGAYLPVLGPAELRVMDDGEAIFATQPKHFGYALPHITTRRAFRDLYRALTNRELGEQT